MLVTIGPSWAEVFSFDLKKCHMSRATLVAANKDVTLFDA